MTGIDVASAYTWDYIEEPVVWDADHQVHRPHRVPYSVQRLDEFLPTLCQKLRILFLDVGRVGKHYGGEIARCRRCPDRSGVTFRYQVRKPA